MPSRKGTAMFPLDVQAGWALGIMAGLCIYSILLLRKHHLDFPCFAIYFGSLLAVSAIRLVVSLVCGRPVYFYAYWGSQLVTLITFLFFVSDLLSRQLGPFPKEHPFCVLPRFTIFTFACCSSIFLTVLLKLLDLNESPRYVLTNYFTTLNQATVGVALVLMGASAVCQWLISSPWDKREVSIVLGIIFELGADSVLIRLVGTMGLAQQRSTLVARLMCLTCLLYGMADVRPDVRTISPEERERIRKLLRKVGAAKSRGSVKCVADGEIICSQ